MQNSDAASDIPTSDEWLTPRRKEILQVLCQHKVEIRTLDKDTYDLSSLRIEIPLGLRCEVYLEISYLLAEFFDPTHKVQLEYVDSYPWGTSKFALDTTFIERYALQQIPPSSAVLRLVESVTKVTYKPKCYKCNTEEAIVCRKCGKHFCPNHKAKSSFSDFNKKYLNTGDVCENCDFGMWEPILLILAIAMLVAIVLLLGSKIISDFFG